ncbi:hypothetical protein ES705_33407 [subsurface metagenome]
MVADAGDVCLVEVLDFDQGAAAARTSTRLPRWRFSTSTTAIAALEIFDVDQGAVPLEVLEATAAADAGDVCLVEVLDVDQGAAAVEVRFSNRACGRRLVCFVFPGRIPNRQTGFFFVS